MISIDLLVIIIVMSLLFLRHVSVYKDPNKINYTPVVLALGIVGALLHFTVYADTLSESELLRESFLALSVGTVLAAIMSVMSQSISTMNAYEERIRLSGIGDDIALLNTSITSLNSRLDVVAQMESTTHDQLHSVFKEEIDALNAIQSNQKLFVSKIESLLAQQQSATAKFEEFTLTELPSLDNVVHRHIDLLRVAEQDHFNQLKNVVRSSCDEQKEVETQLKAIQEALRELARHQQPDHTIGVLQKELDRILHDFSHHLQTIGGKSEAIVTTLLENDALLRGSREQSELIMQQMVLSSKQMKEITTQSRELSDALKPLSRLFASAETLHEEFMDAKGKLAELIVTLESYERQEYRSIRQNLEELASEVTSQLQLLSHTLRQKESSTLIEAKNVQELASKVKLQKSYLGENQE